jgi:hypothetical protein
MPLKSLARIVLALLVCAALVGCEKSEPPKQGPPGKADPKTLDRASPSGEKKPVAAK